MCTNKHQQLTFPTVMTMPTSGSHCNIDVHVLRHLTLSVTHDVQVHMEVLLSDTYCIPSTHQVMQQCWHVVAKATTMISNKLTEQDDGFLSLSDRRWIAWKERSNKGIE